MSLNLLSKIFYRIFKKYHTIINFYIFQIERAEEALFDIIAEEGGDFAIFVDQVGESLEVVGLGVVDHLLPDAVELVVLLGVILGEILEQLVQLRR